MKNNVQLFKSPEFGDLETLEVDGQIYFRATQVATILGYSNPHKAIIDHCRHAQKIEIACDLTNREVTSRARKTQEVNFIPEGDIYRLIASSKLDSADRFEKWVFDEILPSIRKTGFYLDPTKPVDFDFVIELCRKGKEQQRQLALAREQNQLLETKVAELQPKATYYDLILNCKDLVATTQIAKDYGFSARRLNQILKDFDVQFFLTGQKVWCLKAKYADKGYTQKKTHTYLTDDNETHCKDLMYWTQKGRIFLYHFLKEHGMLPLIEQ